jgi:hypothetical protein
MEATKENIEELKKLGFRETRKNKFVYMDVTATSWEGYLSFKYSGKDIPIINKL